MNPSTITSILNEAATLEARAKQLRSVAVQLEKITLGVKAMKKAAEANGVLLSAIAPSPKRTIKPAKPTKTGKRKYTKKSAFWKKK